MRTDVTLDELRVSEYSIPTDQPESDGTYAWNSTAIVVVEAGAGGQFLPRRALAYPGDRTASKELQDT